MRMDPPATPPPAGTRAAAAHAVVHQLRAAVADQDRPGGVVGLVRNLDADRAREALLVAVVSETWPAAARKAMSGYAPPRVDHAAIAAENAALRAAHAERDLEDGQAA